MGCANEKRIFETPLDEILQVISEETGRDVESLKKEMRRNLISKFIFQSEHIDRGWNDSQNGLWMSSDELTDARNSLLYYVQNHTEMVPPRAVHFTATAAKDIEILSSALKGFNDQKNYYTRCDDDGRLHFNRMKSLVRPLATIASDPSVGRSGRRTDTFEYSWPDDTRCVAQFTEYVYPPIYSGLSARVQSDAYFTVCYRLMHDVLVVLAILYSESIPAQSLEGVPTSTGRWFLQ